MALERVSEALDAAIHGLTLDPQNAALKTVKTKIEAREKALSALHRKKREEAEQAQRRRSALVTALETRGIRIRNTAEVPDMQDAVIHLAPDPLSPTSTLYFPVILLYPLHAQSDFIKAFSESDIVAQHLDYILPLPWDEKQEYTMASVECYMETSAGGLVKVGKNVTLGKILSNAGVEVVDGIVRMNVLLKGRTAGWIEEIKAKQRK